MIRFKVPCVPVAQPRQRHRVITVAGLPMATNYTPAKHPVNAFKAAVQLAASVAYQGQPLVGPLMLTVTFLLPRPQRLNRKKCDPGRVWHDSKPDAENLAKSLMDALTGGIWQDDRQVARLSLAKMYAGKDEQPGATVEIVRLEE